MESTSNLSPDLVTRSVNFHGQLLQKTWEAERGEGDLQKQGISNLDYDVYSQRQKHLRYRVCMMSSSFAISKKLYLDFLTMLV